MIALHRIGHAAAGEKRPPEKGVFAAIVFHDGQVNVQGEGFPGIKAKGMHDCKKLVCILDLKDLLSVFPVPCLQVKAKPKGFFKKLRQKRGKLGAFCDDFYGIISKAVAKQQNSKTLRESTAAGLRDGTADFRLGGGGK